MNYSKIESIEVDGLDYNDYPDFVDAFISYAEYEGEIMTEYQLNELNEDSDFVHQCVFKKLF